MLEQVREQVQPLIERHGPIEAWIIDDTGFPKKGRHSVGVARQYCSQLGKQDNCQVAVSLSIANAAASLPIAYRLYLPESWADDPMRRAKAKVPREIVFQTKPAIALDQIAAVQAAGIAPAVVLADAGYGVDGDFRAGLTALGLDYVVGVLSTLSIWRPGQGPLPPEPRSGKGRPSTRMRRSPEHRPLSAKALAQSLSPDAWQTITWREGTNADLSSRFAALWLRPASKDNQLTQPHAEQWLLIEWPQGDAEPLKYWLSTLPADTPIERLVTTAKLRWRIERDYQELKQELGLGHYEGRGWRGFHHHASLCIAAYGSSSPSARLFPPQRRPMPKTAKNLPFPKVIDPADPPIRPQRHVIDSITTVRIWLIATLSRSLPRCPCCSRPMPSKRNL